MHLANDNSAAAAPSEPEITDSVDISGILGESASVWAYAERVVIEAQAGGETTAAHLNVAKAREYAAAILNACVEAERMARG